MNACAATVQQRSPCLNETQGAKCIAVHLPDFTKDERRY